MTQQHYRQGDVLLVRVGEIPPGATPVEDGTVRGRLVVAYGEVTGHHHSVAVADARMVKSAEDVYLEIMRETPLEHQEHAAITLEPGIYRYVPQREYSPEAIRRVAD
jgi:hypothetical protein